MGGGSGAFAARSHVPSARPPPSPSRGRSRRWVAHFRSEYRAPAGVALGAGVTAARDTRDLGGLEARGRAGRRRPGRTGAVRRRRGGPAGPGGLWDRGAQARRRSSAPLPFPPTRAARWALVGGSVTSRGLARGPRWPCPTRQPGRAVPGVAPILLPCAVSSGRLSVFQGSPGSTFWETSGGLTGWETSTSSCPTICFSLL